MAIDPTLDPDMYVFGNAPKALETVIRTHANMLYGPQGDTSRDISAQSEQMKVALLVFKKAAAQGMQFDMDVLAGGRNPQLRYTPR